MADWEIISVNTSNNVWTYASAEAIANCMSSASAKWAYADLGITAISIHYWYINIDIDTTSTDVPIITWDGCDYGMIGLSYGGYYPTTAKFVILTLGETASYVVNFGGGDGGCGGMIEALQGNGYTAFKQSNSDIRDCAVFVYDEAVEELVSGETVRAIVADGAIFDLENGVYSSQMVFGYNTIAQSDGTAFVEVLKIMIADKTDSTGNKVYQSNNVYRTLYDYDSSRDKTVLINGIKMNKMRATNLYISTE